MVAASISIICLENSDIGNVVVMPSVTGFRWSIVLNV
jgi:hypothetical protein